MVFFLYGNGSEPDTSVISPFETRLNIAFILTTQRIKLDWFRNESDKILQSSGELRLNTALSKSQSDYCFTEL